ncbi:3' terminal RNA ribose 2'-O-methyltransferase Hen1 [Chitinophaga lutea]|uniref:Small RNA 2'-O-methyltransferase n=1 Tax=Chitinophaga lutea TaxID=2488634 RepID=A0A3N4PZ02_9BACT|nr:3' terminal RNA ribose 2'-O-methyltransferase Hen1 [Chitinophaga lutea]RPE13116.1 3' terminal RNA ribose 2'-O-methyltransferase Hen1 [Chitinophaga lutea]
MLLTISTTRYPADDLSFLLHKHPARVQEADIPGGIAHIFYTEVSPQKCTAALLLDIDPVSLVRRPAGNDFALEQYVNDRPYVASSFMSGAIAKAFSSAMNGRCKDKPELAGEAWPFEVTLDVLPVRGGETVLRQLFEPLGYTVEASGIPVDPAFPEWGQSRYFSVKLRHTIALSTLLSQLYVLIPVCDNDKHYFVGSEEVSKLLAKGQDWLGAHPMRELIIMRYLKHQRKLASGVMAVLMEQEGEETEEEVAQIPPEKIKIHDIRLMAVRDALLACGASSVADLGCGEGKLLRLLLEEKQFSRVLGMDVSYRSLEIAKDKLKTDRMPPRQQERIQLIQGSLAYRDARIAGFDAAALTEVIEHLDEPRLTALERVLFEFASPGTVIITTPNAEYNVKLGPQGNGRMRHNDHRFEWTRAEFENWGSRVASLYGYSAVYRPIGDEDPEVGAISQMAIFTKSS